MQGKQAEGKQKELRRYTCSNHKDLRKLITLIDNKTATMIWLKIQNTLRKILT